MNKKIMSIVGFLAILFAVYVFIGSKKQADTFQPVLKPTQQINTNGETMKKIKAMND